MTGIRIILGLLLGGFLLARGLWILAVRPDPPAGARTATRKNRQILAIVMIILGVVMIALNVSSISSE